MMDQIFRTSEAVKRLLREGEWGEGRKRRVILKSFLFSLPNKWKQTLGLQIISELKIPADSYEALSMGKPT